MISFSPKDSLFAQTAKICPNLFTLFYFQLVRMFVYCLTSSQVKSSIEDG